MGSARGRWITTLGVLAALTAAAPAGAAAVAAPVTVPHWTGSFDYGGKAWSYRMVGTRPQDGGSTTVATTIVPLRLTFADGSVLDGTDRVADVVASPIFQAADFTSGHTQYGDAIQRASFWQAGGSAPGYHVLLGQPAIAGTVHLKVPKSHGSSFVDSAGVRQAFLDYEWFSNFVHSLVDKLELDPRTLPILLTDTMLLQSKSGHCCPTGFHFAQESGHGKKRGIQTAIWASWMAPNPLHPESERVHVLSHEVAEWIADPLIDNVIPLTDFEDPFYGCYDLLENADPLFTSTFRVNGYQLTDTAHVSWFARQSPSIGQGGRYTYLGTFDSPAQDC
jgi:hypothetical protein